MNSSTKSRLSMMVLGALLSACMTRAAAESVESDVGQDEVLFETYEVVTDITGRPTVLTGFLLGGAVAELAVVHIDENADRRLRIYTFGDGAWVPLRDAILRPGVAFVDVAEIGGRDRLVTYEHGHLSWFDPGSATEHPLVAVTSSFDAPRKDEVPHVDITRDLNGDGRDDLAVPGVDGFWVFIQGRDGAFAEPVKIGPPTDMSGITGADGYRYDPWSRSRVHAIDYDHDGRRDLVSWNGTLFEVHTQGEGGLFAPRPTTFTTDVAFDSDDFDSLASGEMTGRVLHSLADLNGDGVGDLVVFSLQGRSIASKRSAFEVHFGAPTPGGGTAFSPDVDLAFSPDDRIQLALDRRDVDGDGQLDLMFTTIQRERLQGSLWKRLKGFMGDGIGLTLEFHRNHDGRYRATPEATRGIGLIGASDHRTPGWVPLDIVLRGATHVSKRTRTGWPRAFDKNLLIGDVTGDGRTDLLIEHSFRGLAVFPGVPEPGLFASRSQEVAVIVPNDDEYSWLVDLDRNGKQDVLMHHPFTERDIHGTPRLPPGVEPHRLTVLMAR